MRRGSLTVRHGFGPARAARRYEVFAALVAEIGLGRERLAHVRGCTTPMVVSRLERHVDVMATPFMQWRRAKHARRFVLPWGQNLAGVS